MSVNLKKGQKIDLTKNNTGLKNMMVGLGWDEVNSSKGGLFANKKKNIDCDASVLLCGPDGKVIDKGDVVYFGNKLHKSGCVNHMGDNLTGKGEGDDEQIFVNLLDMPPLYSKIIFVVNIYKAVERKQDFSIISNAFIRIVNDDTNEELCKYNLSEDYEGKTAMIFGEVYRYQNEWKFNPIGEPTTDKSISDVLKRYQ